MSQIDRKAHVIKREKSLAMPRHIIFFDTETTEKEVSEYRTVQVLKLGWACYVRKGYGRHIERTDWQKFTTGLEFWSFVYKRLQKKTKLWVIARNVVFDFTIVEGWKYLRQVGFKLKFFHNSGVTSVIAVKGRYGSIVFLDSLNWFVESLAETGKRIGLEKLSIDFDTCTESQLSKYCHRDVEIEVANFKSFMQFLESQSVARLCYTRGSTAMSAFLFSHYDKKIWIHNNAEAIDLERDSYKGGRTECFYLGDLNSENYYIVDVNSLYPFVMAANVYPCKYLRRLPVVRVKTLASHLQTEAAVAKVLIDTDEPVYAVKRDRTIFPTGVFWTVLTTPELKYALERNHIKEIKDVVFYEQADLFSSYVKRFYKLRQRFAKDGNPEYAEFCKKLLNSLYGKFGQKADVWQKIGDCPGERDRVEVCLKSGSNARSSIRYLLGEIFELVGFEECFDSFPAIAAHVTGYARIYLYELMKKAGCGNYFYCDTDSLIVNETGLCRLKSKVNSTRLGALKITDTTTQLIIKGLKDYSVGGKTVVKGIRKNAVKLADGVYEQESWPSFKGLLRDGDVNTYTVKQVRKVLQRKYTKGRVSKDGSITPFVLDETFLLAPQLY